jgi:hypothetical protein
MTTTATALVSTDGLADAERVPDEPQRRPANLPPSAGGGDRIVRDRDHPVTVAFGSRDPKPLAAAAQSGPEILGTLLRVSPVGSEADAASSRCRVTEPRARPKHEHTIGVLAYCC